MKTWFVTGTSRGFGRAWTQVALERGRHCVERSYESLQHYPCLCWWNWSAALTSPARSETEDYMLEEPTQ